MKSILLKSDCLEDRAAMADYYYHEDENIGTGIVMWLHSLAIDLLRDSNIGPWGCHISVLFYTSQSCKQTKNAHN